MAIWAFSINKLRFRPERAAKSAGKSEMEYLNEMIADAKELWKLLKIDYDKFIRTTDD